MAAADMIGVSGDRIGVLGGTFDPVHNGHLAMAEHVLKIFRLDSLLFIPAARPPHKGHIATTPFADRFKMLEQAVQMNGCFFVSDLEADREGPSYSIDTLKGLRGLVADTVELFFIIGTDAFAELDTWKKYRELTDHANLLVIDRPGYPMAMVKDVVGHLGGYSFDPDQACWTSPEHPGRIYPLTIPPVEISSTDVRERIAHGQAFADLVPSVVFHYVTEHGLYKGWKKSKT